MISTEIFEKQSKEYQEEVLPSSVRRRVVIEAGTTFGWDKYATINGRIIGVDRFGQSAPGNIVLEKFGFTSANIVKTATELF